ncbi:MAG: Lrp/AsnC family transcriptional regulator, partial [Pseudomonadota bacterium]
MQELQSEGRLSNVDLANRVGLSPSACLRRVQELERSGIVRGYRAMIDRAQLGIGFTAYVAVGIADHST